MDHEPPPGKYSSSAVVPMLPFNTDGIDPGAGTAHFWAHHVTVENFDDVIAVKPCNGDCAAQQQHGGGGGGGGGDDEAELVCTEDILVEDFSIFLGVGLSVGSVHPRKTIMWGERIVEQLK